MIQKLEMLRLRIKLRRSRPVFRERDELHNICTQTALTSNSRSASPERRKKIRLKREKMKKKKKNKK